MSKQKDLLVQSGDVPVLVGIPRMKLCKLRRMRAIRQSGIGKGGGGGREKGRGGGVAGRRKSEGEKRLKKRV